MSHRSTVKLRPEGEGCQMGMGGFEPLGSGSTQGLNELLAPVTPIESVPGPDAYIASQKARTVGHAPGPIYAAPDIRLAPEAPRATVSPATVVKSAKARIKELRAFLRQAKKAEKELKELERLVDAAKRPLAPVRDIRRANRSAATHEGN